MPTPGPPSNGGVQGPTNGNGKKPVEVMLEVLPQREAVLLGTLQGISVGKLTKTLHCSRQTIQNMRQSADFRRDLAACRADILSELSDVIVPAGKQAARRLLHLSKHGLPEQAVQYQSAKALLEAALKVQQSKTLAEHTLELTEELRNTGGLPLEKLSMTTKLRIRDEGLWGPFDGNGSTEDHTG